MNFRNIHYLKSGSAIQKRAFQVLNELKVFKILKDFDPILVGTIPLDIAIEGSDLDIICCAKDLIFFSEFLKENFGLFDDFSIHDRMIRNQKSLVCQFSFKNFPFEIFGQDCPTEKQDAYLHLLVEAQLLKQSGPKAKKEIIKLKQQGLKTEPAFAKYFNIPGDPYEELVKDL